MYIFILQYSAKLNLTFFFFSFEATRCCLVAYASINQGNFVPTFPGNVFVGGFVF